MTSKIGDADKDKRRLIRRRVRNATDVSCRRGTMGLGPNLALRMLDISEEGVKLLVKQQLKLGEELEVCFTPQGCSKEIVCNLVTVRCGPENGSFMVAGKFAPPLSYDDIYHIL